MNPAPIPTCVKRMSIKAWQRNNFCCPSICIQLSEEITFHLRFISRKQSRQTNSNPQCDSHASAYSSTWQVPSIGSSQCDQRFTRAHGSGSGCQQIPLWIFLQNSLCKEYRNMVSRYIHVTHF